eukprot:CAMPEP_0172153416 /NCGR_PEP_ID=MMETSP1050-20130122/1428_1 /TAXON_ID=233186 /ORGANISM="Cryptomonas curvata, Strain CCAP979/52" /LENGTH=85 /DNA_ID=CAMNT_0012821941 /DNA_START=12 /DNA_END=269 /DNA_ORIENTATION=-
MFSTVIQAHQLLKTDLMLILPNGASGTGGTAAWKEGVEGPWYDECDLSGLGSRDLSPCMDDNSFKSGDGESIVPISALSRGFSAN